MKKIVALTILLLQMTFVFGQNKQWESWTPVSCFSSLSTSVLGNGYVPSISEYSWQVRIKSSYSKKVTFNMTWIVGGERLSIGQVTLSPGESYGHTPRYFKSSSNNIYVEVDKVCFEGQDCYKNGYADCSGNQVVNKTANSTNNSNSPKTDQTFDRNNASFQDYYKRATAAGQAGNYDEAISLWNSAISVAVNEDQRNNARAWLDEAQKAKANSSIQANNAEIQRKNLENQKQQQLLKEQQRQQYNNTVNQGSNNLQNGNYTGAMQSYTNAINSATTKSEKNLAATGALVSGLGGVFDALAKAKEEKLERERIEQMRKEEKRERDRIEQEQKERELQVATNIMEANWKDANTFAEQGDYNQALKLMYPYLNANKINAYSTSLIGFWYVQIKDYENAKKCYEKALKLDSKSCAMHQLGDLYQYGQGVEVDYVKASTYYKQSCENNDKTGCENYKKLKPLVEALAIEKIKKINTVNLSVGTIMPFYKNGKFGFQDVITKEPKIKEQFSIVGEFSNGLALAKLDDKYGYLDKLGNIAIPFIYTKAYDFIDEVAVVATNTRIVNGNTYSCDYEIIDMTGKTIAKYFLMYDFKEGLARARNADNKWGYIDAKANIVIPFTIEGYDGADDFNDGLAKVKVFDGKHFKYGYIDKTGSMVIPAQYDSMSESFYEGMAKIEIKDKYGFINKSGDLIVPPKYTRNYFGEFSEGLASVKKGEKYGFIDKTGTEVISLMYDGAGKFSEGLAYVRLKDKLGFIDKEGTVIIALIYDGCSAFKDGLANVKVNGKWGCINRSGKEIIPFKYDKLGGFENGLALIKLNDKTGMIDKNGNEYW